MFYLKWAMIAYQIYNGWINETVNCMFHVLDILCSFSLNQVMIPFSTGSTAWWTVNFTYLSHFEWYKKCRRLKLIWNAKKWICILLLKIILDSFNLLLSWMFLIDPYVISMFRKVISCCYGEKIVSKHIKSHCWFSDKHFSVVQTTNATGLTSIK
jgi:hypothetical protein